MAEEMRQNTSRKEKSRQTCPWSINDGFEHSINPATLAGL